MACPIQLSARTLSPKSTACEQCCGKRLLEGGYKPVPDAISDTLRRTRPMNIAQVPSKFTLTARVSPCSGGKPGEAVIGFQAITFRCDRPEQTRGPIRVPAGSFRAGRWERGRKADHRRLMEPAKLHVGMDSMANWRLDDSL